MDDIFEDCDAYMHLRKTVNSKDEYKARAKSYLRLDLHSKIQENCNLAKISNSFERLKRCAANTSFGQTTPSAHCQTAKVLHCLCRPQ